MFGFHPFFSCYPAQPLNDVINVNTVEVEYLAARKYCGNDLVLFGGCEDKYGMRRGLFEGLQESVEGG